MRIHDISMPIRSGGLVYPGNPPIEISSQQAISRGAGANVSAVSLGSHTATHVDAPKHFIDDGETVDALSLEKLVGRARLIALDDSVLSIGAAELERHDIGDQTRLLMRTRNSALVSRSEFVRDYTYLAPDGADYLVARGIQLVGVDYLSIEQFRSGHHRTHRALLSNDVVIIEGLMLGGIVAGDYDLICLPLRLEGLDGAPARAILIER